MSAQHTRGPWSMAAKPSSVVGWPVVGPEGRSIASISWVNPRSFSPAYVDFNRESEANARLIAAAPELLEACIAIDDVLTRGVMNCEGGTLTKAMDDLRAAIAKAEGRS